jgi:hypothetical protein
VAFFINSAHRKQALQAPYEARRIVELAAFGETDLLDSGDALTVRVLLARSFLQHAAESHPVDVVLRRIIGRVFQQACTFFQPSLIASMSQLDCGISREAFKGSS